MSAPTSDQLLYQLMREVAQAAIEHAVEERLSPAEMWRRRGLLGVQIAVGERLSTEGDPDHPLSRLRARLNEAERLRSVAVLRCGHDTAELRGSGPHASHCSACVEALRAGTPPLDSRLYAAAREIQREADRRMRAGQAWVPGTDWLLEVMLRAMHAPVAPASEL